MSLMLATQNLFMFITAASLYWLMKGYLVQEQTFGMY